MVGAVAIGIWIDLAQNSFLRAHAKAPGSRSFARDDLTKATMRPWRLVRGAPLAAIFALNGVPQRDPALESLRQRYLGRLRIGLSLVFATWIVWLVSRLS